MELNLSDKRKNYSKFSLDEKLLSQNPMEIFAEWYKMSETEMGEIEANAMTLSTVDDSGMPHARIVLLKYFSVLGFEFFTHYKSNKGIQIEKNPKVCLSFFWEGMERQVIVNGLASQLSPEVSEAYFDSRPLESRMAAIVSNQSKPLQSKKELLEKWKKLQQENQTLKRPEFWGGYRVEPISIEFWQGGEHRLHDRILFRLDEDKNWFGTRLNP